jgi:hypothetical protein
LLAAFRAGGEDPRAFGALLRVEEKVIGLGCPVDKGERSEHVVLKLKHEPPAQRDHLRGGGAEAPTQRY